MTAKADSRRTPISEPESITEFRKFFVFSQATGDPEGIAKDMLDYIDVLQAALHTARTQLADADKTLETVRIAMGTSTVMEGLNVIDRLRDEIHTAREEASRAIPDGYVLVPSEPTFDICKTLGGNWEGGWVADSKTFPERWRAMLASVLPPAPGDK